MTKIKNIHDSKDEGLTMKGLWKITLTDIVTGEKTIIEKENVICTVGKTLIANNISSATPDNDPAVNYFAVGTDATAVNASDTALGTETYRKQISSRTNSGAVAYFSGFLSATEDSGTYSEFGLFCNGTAVADSGILLSHANISVVKSNTQTLSIDITITIQ